jgi:HK97 family phage major capsid protein
VAKNTGNGVISRSSYDNAALIAHMAKRSPAKPVAPLSKESSFSTRDFPRTAAPPQEGFSAFGEFLQAVVSAADVANADPRLMYAVRSPAGLGEQDPSAGGFIVPTAYLEQLMVSLYAQAAIAPLCSRFDVEKSTSVKMPAIDETSRADGSRMGGAIAYWANEGDNVSASFPRFKMLEFGGHKLIALVKVTNELLADAQLLPSYLTRSFAAEMSFKLDNAILTGNGAGVPLGIVNAPATITVAKENGQAAATITAGNVAGMWSRLPAPCRARAVWLINEDAEAQLEQLNPSATASATGLYMPAGAGGNPFPLLKGRPVIVAEQCPVLGAQGDIVLADMSQYAIVESALKTALSLDVRFITDEGAFRFVWRVDGKPLWASPISSFNGGAARSPFVTLGKR